MAVDRRSKESAENRLISSRHGTRTARLLGLLQAAQPVPVGFACDELKSETPPFNERLSAYIAQRFGVADSYSTVRSRLLDAGDKKGLDFSSANLNQWLSGRKWELSLDPQSLFKLCLAMELDVEESKAFTYSCLHQTWLNYRVAREAIYLFFLETQTLFGDEAFAHAREISSWAENLAAEFCDLAMAGPIDSMGAPGYTRMIADSIRSIAQEDNISAEQALLEIKRYVERNLPAFFGIQRTAIQVYDTYFSKGAFGITPLVQLYKEATGLTLPKSGYLDCSRVQEDKMRKRLLWGTVNRRDWIKHNGADVDILNKHDILIEEHAVGKMRVLGVPRGNIIALLFFHFCYEHSDQFNKRGTHADLFEHFYSQVNTTLVDECGMMPLHPRKPFDALFMKSVALSDGINPIEYLNQLLETYYV